MVSESELRARIAKVLIGDLTLDQFADWLASASWNMHKEASAEVQRMVGAIQLALAEYADGSQTADDVRALLRSFVLSDQIQTAVASVQVFVYMTSPGPAKLISNVSANSLKLSDPPNLANRHDTVLEELIPVEI